MSALQTLRQLGPMEAAFIAGLLNIDIDDVYRELIHAEALGLARVRVTYAGRQVLAREWVAA